MNNKKAFTLVEILAVVSLLSILALLILPNILEQKENKEKQLTEAEKQVLYVDAGNYVRENYDVLENNTYCVSINTLISEGKISMDADDFENKVVKVFSDENNNFIYSIVNANKCVTTASINAPATAINITSNITTCSKNRTITVTGSQEGASLQYKIGENGTWTDINNNGTFTTAVNDTIYARLYDKTTDTGTKKYETLTLTKNGDTTPVTQTAPTLSNITTKSVTITSTQTDDCEIDTSTLEYGYSTSANGTYTWGSSSTLTGLTNGQTYYVKTRVNDIAGNGLTESNYSSFTTKAITLPTVVFDDADWDTSHTATASYTKGNITNAYYYVRSTSGGTSNIDLTTCTGSISGTTKNCSGDSTKNMSAGVWYQVATSNTASVEVTLTSNGSVYAAVSDGSNLLDTPTAETTHIDDKAPTCGSFSGGSTTYAKLDDGTNSTSSSKYATLTVTKIDTDTPGTTAPTLSSSTTTSITITNKQTDGCGLDTSTLEYGYSTSASGTYTWQSSATFTGLTAGTTYYFKTRVNDIAGNGLTTSSYASFTTADTTPPSTPTISNPSNEVCTGDSFSLTLGSTDNVGIAYYQYTYSASATTTGSDATSSWVTYANSASTSYTTTAFSAQRNQLVYVRACDSAGNCSSSNSTYIRIGTAKTSDTACYSSIQAAVNNNTSGTISVLKNTTENLTVSSGKSFTMFFNGKTMTGTLTNSGSLGINGNGLNTTLINASSSSSPAVTNKGTMQINNGRILGNTVGIYQDSNSASATIKGGYIGVNSGSIINNDPNYTGKLYTIGVSTSSGTVNGLVHSVWKISDGSYRVGYYNYVLSHCPTWSGSQSAIWYTATYKNEGYGNVSYCTVIPSQHGNPSSYTTHFYYNNNQFASGFSWTSW